MKLESITVDRIKIDKGSITEIDVSAILKAGHHYPSKLTLFNNGNSLVLTSLLVYDKDAYYDVTSLYSHEYLEVLVHEVTDATLEVSIVA